MGLTPTASNNTDNEALTALTTDENNSETTGNMPPRFIEVDVTLSLCSVPRHLMTRTEKGVLENATSQFLLSSIRQFKSNLLNSTASVMDQRVNLRSSCRQRLQEGEDDVASESNSPTAQQSRSWHLEELVPLEVDMRLAGMTHATDEQENDNLGPLVEELFTLWGTNFVDTLGNVSVSSGLDEAQVYFQNVSWVRSHSHHSMPKTTTTPTNAAVNNNEEAQTRDHSTHVLGIVAIVATCVTSFIFLISLFKFLITTRRQAHERMMAISVFGSTSSAD